MNNSEFKRAVDEHLTGNWGDKSYGPGIIAKLWQIVQHLNVGDFKAALENLCLTSTRPPSLGQIKGALLPALQRAREDQVSARIKKLGRCEYCDGGGWVYVIPYDNPQAEEAFLCPKCQAANVRGMTAGRGAEYWRDELQHKYFVRRFTGPAWLEAERLQAEARAVYLKPKEVKKDGTESGNEKRNGEAERDQRAADPSASSERREAPSVGGGVRDDEIPGVENCPW